MSYLFYIDNQLTDQPDNDMELSTQFKRDEAIGAVLITQEVKLKYSGNNNLEPGVISGYTYLRSLFDSGVCNEATLTILLVESPLVTHHYYSGVIKIAQLEIDVQQVSAASKVQDNSFYSYIKNNQNIQVEQSATQTKNKETLTPLDAYTCDMFDSINGVRGSFIGALYRCYRVYDLFRFLIAAITDNKVGFESDYLTQSDTELFLFKGQSIVTPFSLYPLAPEPLIQISLGELLVEINKLKGVGFYIDATDPAAPVFRLESLDSLYGAASGLSLTNSDLDEVLDLKLSIASDHLYSRVNVGSEATIDGGDSWYTFNEATSYFGFKKEPFHPLGQCNIDSELDLVNEFVISSNVIQDALYGATSQIDSLFLIECNNIDTGALTCDAVAHEYFGTAPPYFYNLGLNNYNKLQNHSSKFITNLGNFLGIGGNGFRALLGDDALNNITYMTGGVSNPNFIPPGGLTIDPSEFPNETTNGGYDGNGNYDNVAFEYTVPTDGDYSFLQRIYAAAAGISVDYFEVHATITLYDSGMTIKDSHTAITDIIIDQTVTVASVAFACTAQAGDIVRASYRLVYQPNGATGQQNPRFLQISYASYFECNGTPEGGITIASGTGGRYLQYEFQYDLSDTQYRLLTANPTQSMEFTKDGNTYIGWIKELKRNDWTGRTTLKLITNAP